VETRAALFDGGPGRDSIGSRDDEEDRTDHGLDLYGGRGDDRMFGGVLPHAGKRNLMKGGPGDDRARGFLADEAIRGGGGNDRLDGGGGDDRLSGGRGNDELKGDDPVQGLPGHDRANGGAGRDQCEAEVTVRCES
jgi:Ca2+-binding RTX toxin-like protein